MRLIPLFLLPQLAVAASPFLQDVRQLTFAGERSGEGYFSADGKEMVFQSEREKENPFFQIYRLDLETGDTTRVSPGTGKTTCGWIHPSGNKILFASTHEDPESVAKQRAEYEERASGEQRRYSWDYDPHYDIFASGDGGLTNLTRTGGYDAEGAYSPDGEWIVFASDRRAHDGSLTRPEQLKVKLNPAWAMEIYRMRADGSEVERLTEAPGYDGGPFFSADGKKICWRRFDEEGATAEIWTMDADGKNKKQLTQLGAMSWAPFFHPSGEYLVFATNLHGFANFELYLVDAAGTREPVRVTEHDGFDGLPVFSPAGDQLSWTSQRGSDGKSQIFLAGWNHAAAQKALAAPGGDPSITAKEMRSLVETLASKEMGGRLTGTEGEQKATAFVARELEALGLEPAGDRGSYFQEFDFTAGVALGESNVLSTGTGKEFEVEKDWRPLAFSQTGDLGSAEVVFAGYGIEAPGEGSYSSYVHLDVENKWVMLFRFMPDGFDAGQRQDFARYSSLRYKAMTAREKGAKGILVVSGPNSKVKNELAPLTFDASLAGSGIGAIALSNAAAQAILGESHDLKALQEAHDSGEMQNGIPLESVSLTATVDVVQERRTGRNVVARLASGKTAPPVIIGAHIDHLGSAAGPNSLSTGDEDDMVHYGADDNASGVAGLVEIASYLSSANLPLERDVLFGAWSGEELGLLGSAHFASAVKEGERAYSAYLNMDMIGRFRDTVIVQGVGSSPEWPALIEQRNAPVGLAIQTQNDSYLPTDATSFYLKGVPVLSVFTGSHEDYHKPSDTAEKLDYPAAARIARFIGLVARGLATSTEVPAYAAMEKPENLGSRASLRAYLGTVPDYAQGDVPGVKLSGVAKLGPAEKAGVRGGDIIVRLAGKEVKNIYDYTFVIEALKIGEEVEITVLRKGEETTFPLVPGSRD